jgi:hypothetical protein
MPHNPAASAAQMWQNIYFGTICANQRQKCDSSFKGGVRHHHRPFG